MQDSNRRLQGARLLVMAVWIFLVGLILAGRLILTGDQGLGFDSPAALHEVATGQLACL